MQGLLALQRYFDFSGRSARAEYWQYLGLYTLVLIIAYLLDLTVSGPYATPTLSLIVLLGGIIPAYAVGVRRLHDRGRTGRWMLLQAIVAGLVTLLTAALGQAQYTPLGDILIVVVRVIGVVNLGLAGFFLVEFVRRGEPHTNAYGPDPLEQPASVAKPTGAARWPRETATVTPARATPPAAGADPLEQIERLAKLRDAGMLTEEEFSQQKAAYLSRL